MTAFSVYRWEGGHFRIPWCPWRFHQSHRLCFCLSVFFHLSVKLDHLPKHATPMQRSWMPYTTQDTTGGTNQRTGKLLGERLGFRAARGNATLAHRLWGLLKRNLNSSLTSCLWMWYFINKMGVAIPIASNKSTLIGLNGPYNNSNRSVRQGRLSVDSILNKLLRL